MLGLVDRSKPHLRSEWDEDRLGFLINGNTEMIELKCTGTSYLKDGERVESEGTPPFRVDVHKDLLCWFSSYYDAALYGQFAEANTTSFTLDLDGEAARLFVVWLYSGRIITLEEDTTFPLYIFADKHDLLALRRSILTHLARHGKGLESDTAVDYCLVQATLKKLPNSSALRRYLIDLYIHHWSPDVEEGWGSIETHDYKTMSKSFLYEVMCGLSRKSTEKVRRFCPCHNNPCNYHEHTSFQEWLSSQYIFHPCMLMSKY
ncbi:hypothetical protein D6D26_10414 [Aureobasidium pullulans]|nr:hypothetical protein D6D26_10414 [Aureobasidium pullulans]